MPLTVHARHIYLEDITNIRDDGDAEAVQGALHGLVQGDDVARAVHGLSDCLLQGGVCNSYNLDETAD